MPWDSTIAQTDGQVLTDLHLAGKRIAAMDVITAAHALALDAVLVTSDKAFCHITGLMPKDWASPKE